MTAFHPVKPFAVRRAHRPAPIRANGSSRPQAVLPSSYGGRSIRPFAHSPNGMLALTMTLRNLANEPVSATSLTGSAAISGARPRRCLLECCWRSEASGPTPQCLHASWPFFRQPGCQLFVHRGFSQRHDRLYAIPQSRVTRASVCVKPNRCDAQLVPEELRRGMVGPLVVEGRGAEDLDRRSGSRTLQRDNGRGAPRPNDRLQGRF